MHALSLVAASLSLASALQIEPTPAVKPLLKLRGGLGGIDAGQVVTIVQVGARSCCALYCPTTLTVFAAVRASAPPTPASCRSRPRRPARCTASR